MARERQYGIGFEDTTDSVESLARRMVRFFHEGEYAKSGLTMLQIDPREFQMGCKVELEHTDDPQIAAKIASDHLAEHPRYYTKLKKAGL